MQFLKKLINIGTIITCNLSIIHAASDGYSPHTPPLASRPTLLSRISTRHTQPVEDLTPVPFVFDDLNDHLVRAPEDLRRLLNAHIKTQLLAIQQKEDAARTIEEVAFYRAHTTAGQIPYETLPTIVEPAEIAWRNIQTEFLHDFFTKAIFLVEHRLTPSLNRQRIHASAPQSPFDMVYQQIDEQYHPIFYLSLLECLLSLELALENNLKIQDALDWTLAYMFRDESDTDESDIFNVHDNSPLADD